MGRPGVAHDFTEDLARSHRVEDEAWWPALYRRRWPSLAGMESLRHDRTMQRAGCDRRLLLGDGDGVLVEEKVRHARGDGRSFDDVLIEVRADVDRQSPGWILKRDARCDWLAYVNLPADWALLVPWPALQGAYEENKWEWAALYGSVDSPNETGGRRWVTRSIPVPLAVVMAAAGGECLLVRPLAVAALIAEAVAAIVPTELRCLSCGLASHLAAAWVASRAKTSGVEFCGCPL